MKRSLAIIALTVATLRPAAAQRLEPPRFAELLAAHVKNNLPAGALQTIGKGEPIDAPMVYVTVTGEHVLLYGRRLLRLSRRTIPPALVRSCQRTVCVPRVRDRVATARARLAYKLGSMPRVLVFVDAAASYTTVLSVLRSIAEAGAALSLRLAALDRGGNVVALPVLVWPQRRVVIDHAGRPALIRIEVSGIGGIVSATRTYLGGPRRAHNARELGDVLGRLKLASGRNAAFVSAGGHTTAGQLIGVVARARELFDAIILTAPGDGIYARP